jgi:hypothetical protein
MTPLTATVLADIDRIAAEQNAADDDANSFWREFGKVHRDPIARHGFETFKRHVTGYGSWQITKFANRFTLRCLAALVRRGKLPAIARIDWRDAELCRYGAKQFATRTPRRSACAPMRSGPA